MKFNDKEQKNALYIAGGLAVAAIIYKMTLGDDASGSIDPTGNGYIPGSGTPQHLVFNPKVIADKLHDAMKDWGTDEAAIFAELKKVSTPQFADVEHWFGKRAYNRNSGNNLTLPGVNLPMYRLAFWLKNELDDTDYNSLRHKYPNYL